MTDFIDYLITEELPPNFRWDPINPVRGTERFYVRTAEEMTRMGRKVEVVYDGPTTERNGVIYRDRSKHNTACPNANDVWLMNPRSNLDVASHKGPIRIWTNFYFDHPKTYEDWLASLDIVYDDLVVISSAARSLMPSNLTPRIVPHGVDHGYYAVPTGKTKVVPERRRQVAFTSSPDRGLDYLRDVWARHNIRATTGYELVVGTYGNGDRTSDESLRRILWQSDFWIHPGRGNELFSLAAAEAQAAGCTPIVVPSGGLAQTVRHGYRFTRESFEEGLVAVLMGEATMAGITARHIPTWKTATAALMGWESLVI